MNGIRTQGQAGVHPKKALGVHSQEEVVQEKWRCPPPRNHGTNTRRKRQNDGDAVARPSL